MPDPPELPDRPRAASFELLALSVGSLYLELLLIRWAGSEIQALAYHKNLVLLAAFLGLGIGSLLAHRTRRYVRSAAVAMAVAALAVLAVSRVPALNLAPPAFTGQYYWGARELTGLPATVRFHATLVVFLLALALPFVALGQRIGQLFSAMPPLRAYSVNTLGSLLGIWLFSLLSMAGATPAVWICIPLGLALFHARAPRWLLVSSGVVAAGTVAGLHVLDDAIWSPYYRIQLRPRVAMGREGSVAIGHELLVNADYHQRILDLSPRFLQDHGIDPAPFAGYDLPYRFAPGARRVLVVGAGTGNDVAAALRSGCERVDAVEIDPVIQRLGRELHPERPYASPRVRAILNDARAHFKTSPESYDLVVFGLLDSHTLLSGIAGLRLDNYVYTQESLREAALRLAPGGRMALSFAVSPDSVHGGNWILQRIRTMVHETFGQEPLALATQYDAGVLFVGGHGDLGQGILGEPDIAWRVAEAARLLEIGDPRLARLVPSDDWPFLYLRDRAIPGESLVIFLLIGALAAGAARLALPAFRRVSWHFLLLGAAFLLVETKNIAQLALLFGATWVVTTVAISAILVMILLANAAVERFPRIPREWAYAGLGVCLVLNWLVPVQAFVGWGMAARVAGAGLWLAGPVFFSGLVFARSFSRAAVPAVALGSNLLGAVLGAFLENASLVYGIRALNLLALGVYALSWLLLRTGREEGLS